MFGGSFVCMLRNPLYSLTSSTRSESAHHKYLQYLTLHLAGVSLLHTSPPDRGVPPSVGCRYLESGQVLPEATTVECALKNGSSFLYFS